jgi:broad specificity phosphatase PhoE
VGDVELWVARHGETEWSRSGRHTGSTDLPLTDKGREAARALGARLRGEHFDLVLTSPMRRARDTCALAGLGDAAVVVDDLHEWDYGDYEGVTTEEIHLTRPGWTVFSDGCPGGEVAAQVAERADRVIDTVRAIGSGRAFAHGHILRVLGARWVALPAQDGARLALDTATISVLGWDRGTPTINRWNTA